MPTNRLRPVRSERTKDCHPWSRWCTDSVRSSYTYPYCGIRHVPFCIASHSARPARPVHCPSSGWPCGRPWHRCYPVHWPIVDALWGAPWQVSSLYPRWHPAKMHPPGSCYQSSASGRIIRELETNRQSGRLSGLTPSLSHPICVSSSSQILASQ